MRARQGGMALHQMCQLLDLERDGLFNQLKEGKSIAEIAEEHGINRDELMEELMGLALDRLDKAVEKGKLDEQRAEELKQNVEKRLAGFLDDFPRGWQGKQVMCLPTEGNVNWM